MNSVVDASWAFGARKIHVIAPSLLGASLLWDMPGKKSKGAYPATEGGEEGGRGIGKCAATRVVTWVSSKAKAAVQAPGDPHPPPKPAPPARTTHMPTKEVFDEYVKGLGVENVTGTGIRVLNCALSVNEIEGLPAIPEDVCSVRERLQKLQQENGCTHPYSCPSILVTKV